MGYAERAEKDWRLVSGWRPDGIRGRRQGIPSRDAER